MSKLNDSAPRERRKVPRYKVNCRCWIEQDSMTLFGTVTNLSSGGIFLRTLPILNVGAGVEIKLSLDSGVVVANGRIKWQNTPVTTGGQASEGSTAPPGLGIELTELKSGDQLLERYVQRVSLIPEPE